MTATARTQRGLILGLCLDTGRARLSGFSRAQTLSDETRRLTLLDGQQISYLGSAQPSGTAHWRINALAVTAGEAGVINTVSGCLLPRPSTLGGLYITECELEVDPGFARRMLTEPERYLTHLSPMADTISESALPQDRRTQCWHLTTSDGTTEVIGFAPRSLLQMLGVRYHPLGDVAALANWMFDDMAIGPGGLQPVLPLLPAAADHSAQLPTQLARHAETPSRQPQLQIHCPTCTQNFAFPTGKYVERLLKLRCPSCASVFLGEILRSDQSL